MPYKELRGNGACESSDEIRQRVERARAVQLARGYLNAEMPSSLIRKRCALDDAGERTLEMAVRKMGLSARTHDRILKVAAPSPIWMSRKLSRPSTWAKPCNTEASIVITGAEGRSGADVHYLVDDQQPRLGWKGFSKTFVRLWQQSDNVPFGQSRNVPLTPPRCGDAGRTTTDDPSRS